MKPLLNAGTRIWNATRFGSLEVSAYAEPLLVRETRRGVVTLCLVACMLLIGSVVVHHELGLDRGYVYTSLALAALCAHVSLSARAVNDLQTLHALGMALLIISGTAFVLLGHRSGSLGAVLFTSAALLFMVVPLVPWGLREASLITLLLYTVFTSSSWTVASRFDSETLWALQVFMLAAGAVSLILVAHGTRIRKEDLETRYALESARREVEQLSLEDPLTRAWNRRFLSCEFSGFVEEARKQSMPAWFVAIDVNGFKRLNDRHGHTVGDDVLRWLSQGLALHVGDRGHVVRTGGDEFVVLLCQESPEEVLQDALETIQARARSEGPAGLGEVSLSAGAVRLPEEGLVQLDEVYTAADGALYHAKRSEQSVLRLAMRTLPPRSRTSP